MSSLWLSVYSVSAQEAYRLYVSPAGDDAARGTSVTEAFRSIEKAQQAVRALKEEGKATQPIVVTLQGGNYFIRKPLVFTQADGGSEAAPVTYEGAAGEKALIHGGAVITGWKPYKKGIWRTRLPSVQGGKWKFRQLFVNGSIRTRARIPNDGFLRVKGFPDGGPEVHYHTDCQRFEFAPGDLRADWKNLQDVEVIVYHFWTDSHLPIQSIDARNRIVTFRHKAGKVFTDDFTKEGARYIVENVWEGLDSPGEWYLDQKEGWLYYIPQPGEDMNKAEVIAPVVSDFIRIEGKPMTHQFVSHLTFRNLSFSYSNWDLPPGNSNDRQGSASVPAGITLAGTQNCAFEDCSITNIGTFAFDIGAGSQHNRIRNCQMAYLGGGGIRINGGTDQEHPLLRTGHTEIADNRIDHYGEVFPSAVGVLLMHTDRNQVLHNEISNGSYTGVSVGWVWGYGRSVSNHNHIEYNYIHHIGQKGLLSDMGGIYTLGVSPGTTLRNNIIHDVNANHYGGWGIYNDEGSSYILVENNLVYRTKFAPYNIHFSKEITVRNNIFALGKLEQLSRGKVEPHKSVYLENNLFYWEEGELLAGNWKDQVYTFYPVPGDSLLQTSTFESDYNLFYRPGLTANQIRWSEENWADWHKREKDVHSLVADPLFVDVSRHDFRLKPGSPAFGLGFVAIDFSKVGVRKK